MTAAATYREIAPSAASRDFVRCVWVYEAHAAETEPQRIAPDGRAELIVHLGEPYAELTADGAVTQPPILFAGQLTRPLTLLARGDVRVLGVRFEPDGARAFLGQPMACTTDRRVDLAELHGPQAARVFESLRQASSWDARVDLAQNYAAEQISTDQTPIDPIVRDAVRRLEGAASLGDVKDRVSERRLERLFQNTVGVSPRMLASIFRFRRVFDLMERPEQSTWVETALAAGYFDQPQMARDFRRFLGCTAREWARQKLGLAVLLTRSEVKHAGVGNVQA